MYQPNTIVYKCHKTGIKHTTIIFILWKLLQFLNELGFLPHAFEEALQQFEIQNFILGCLGRVTCWNYVCEWKWWWNCCSVKCFKLGIIIHLSFS